ncbi:E3 ubiquitin/ISG15 ligase TRIM25-like isoform X2 [Pungitius pungitius]|uniref:E3 ubiquitin/ISG15 ligase TRIM25-like isoform X2 n=1 Tax=Pungitius pungitius TaxID=134920 RepID=UPI002E151926
MAEMDVGPFSLISLEDELTCSICLSPFDCPVTIPCGHNFCQECLLATWKDSYSCPQCRTHFPTKPDLKKNTVLSTVVETFNLRTAKSAAGPPAEGGEKEEKEARAAVGKEAISCDTCMQADATHTCLTCMASFCEEHLRPHRENPTFRLHQLSQPIGDLSERICPDHHKLMELFCSQHSRPICSLCLQQVHKGCSFTSPEEQRNKTELGLRDKLGLLVGQIEKTETAVIQIKDQQSKLKDATGKRKATLVAVHQQMRDLLDQEERQAQRDVDLELELCQVKLRDHMKRTTDNAAKMAKAQEQINTLLSQSQTLGFLQATFDFNAKKFNDPSVPRIKLDSKKVKATQAFPALLKEHLTEVLKQPVEARILILKPDKKGVPVSAPASTGFKPESEVTKPPQQRRQPRSHSPGRPLIESTIQPRPGPVYLYMGSQPGWNLPQHFYGPPQGYYVPNTYMAGQATKKEWRPPNARGGNMPSGFESHQF